VAAPAECRPVNRRRRAVCGRTARTDRWGAGENQPQSATPRGTRRLPPTRHNVRSASRSLLGRGRVTSCSEGMGYRRPTEDTLTQTASSSSYGEGRRERTFPSVRLHREHYEHAFATSPAKVHRPHRWLNPPAAHRHRSPSARTYTDYMRATCRRPVGRRCP
jgi:hypothetical protein